MKIYNYTASGRPQQSGGTGQQAIYYIKGYFLYPATIHLGLSLTLRTFVLLH